MPMILKWAIGVFLGYWLAGVVGLIVFDSYLRSTLRSVLGMIVFALMWGPIWVMDVVERASARIKVDFGEEEDHNR